MSYEANKKWRENHRPTFYAGKKRNYRKGARNQKNARTIWEKEDELRIIDPGRPCDRVLAVSLGRTVQAIQAHRHLIKI